MTLWKPKVLKGFADAAQSLKLYRRAELLDQDDRPLIEQLYVDPLPSNGVLNAMVRPNTTFIVGRKGTGKSTVFQRAQHEIRKQKNSISAYIDIKTVFESAAVDPNLLQKAAANSSALTEEDLKKLLLYKSFLRAVLSEIRKELQAQIDASYIERIKEKLGIGRNEIFDRLDEILNNAFEADFTDVTAVEAISSREKSIRKNSSTRIKGSNIGLKVDTTQPSAEVGARAENNAMSGSELENEQSFSRVLLRNLNITGVMEEIQELLQTIDIRHLYIFVDDFSELPEDAMVVFVDTILSPLNNWSNELIKFKIAAYPGRIYYGKVDKTKIDELYLDVFKLYGANDVATMEDKAVDFTRRLIENRIKHYCKSQVDDFFASNTEEVIRHLFFATMGNPRNLGHILFNVQESHLAFGRMITVRAVRDAAAKYYDEKIEPFFGMQKFRQETFSERASVFSLKELLESIVERARELRSYRGSAILRGLEGQPPTSHFHVLNELENLLSTLELNFFLTKYFEMKDRDGKKVSVFALNYGLCNKYTIEFGRPASRREHRLYFVERIFDYTPILRSYLQENQEIKCDGCGEIYGIDKLEALAMFDMLCPKCRTGTCQVVNLSKKYAEVLQDIKPELLLPETELGILEALYSENRELYAREIAEELDCSYQLVGKRGKIMEERGLVSRDFEEKKRRIFKITDQAVRDYFADNEERRLHIGSDGEPELDESSL